MNWDEYFFKMVDLVASKSKDKSTKVGAVIVGPDHRVVATGYNGFPMGVNDIMGCKSCVDLNLIDKRYERPEKYYWTEHAERNAIYSAACNGIALGGCTMYTQSAPCADCARAIIQSGIICVKVECIIRPGMGHWRESVHVGVTMMTEAGVEIIDNDGDKVVAV